MANADLLQPLTTSIIEREAGRGSIYLLERTGETHDTYTVGNVVGTGMLKKSRLTLL
jgi:hypothetical protein